MSENRKKEGIRSLDFEIQLVQLDKNMNDFENAMKKDLRSGLKKLLLIVGPLILSFIGFLIFKNPNILMVGISITGIGSVVTLSKDFIKDIKSLNLKSYKANSNIINIKQEEDIEKILQDIEKTKTEDFYREEYKFAKEKVEAYVESEEDKKYREALERQQLGQKNKASSNFKIVGNDIEYLNKEETMIQVVREIDAYTMAYKLSPLEISNSQWDMFFDDTYKFFLEKGIEKEFYE